ncbi:hypothetical protein BaRGS_00038526 [Batillaria attramentaria]|uniref:Uncharacterized protein n=1 Tax=Batillaria attramentaria TaxID=370345 RepID=A0ABD0J5S2_9CAEN
MSRRTLRHCSQTVEHEPQKTQKLMPSCLKLGLYSRSEKAREMGNVQWNQTGGGNETGMTELLEMIREGRVCYVGATIDPNRREVQHVRRRYRGKEMWYAETDNMRRDENKLLEAADGRTDNIHQRSNKPEKPGYVYGIRR